jgi:hypothetical protein
MWDLKLPKNMFILEEYMKLSPQKREAYVHNTIKEIVEMNESGISISDIEAVTKFFSRKAIEKHLEILVATNEVYTKHIGKTIVFYPNGKLVHGKLQREMRIDENNILKFQIVDNPFGEFLFFHQVARLEMGELIKGGLMIPREKIKELKNFIDSIEKEIEVLKNGD